MRFVVDWGKRQEALDPGSRLVVIASTDWSAEGHDLMLVHAMCSAQPTAAVASGIDAVISRDLSGFAHSSVPVWSPAEWLQRLAQQSP